MRILVTGGAGFIGSNFIYYWLKKYPADKIINLDKLTYAGNPDNLSGIRASSNYRFIKGDITNRRLVESLLEEVDWVVHFAAESHVDRSILSPAPFIKTNILGTYILLEAAVRHKIKKFHHISTDEVFGSLPLSSTQKFNEGSPYRPSSPYAASKASADHLVRAYFKTYGLPVTITNCSNNYGPYQYPEKLIPLAITNLLEGKKVPIYGHGKHIRDWLYVEDHCRAIDLILKEGKIGETYCLGGKESTFSNLSVVKKILEILGKGEENIIFVKDRPGHDEKYALDSTKIRKTLGWQPIYDFEKGLAITINWYQKNISWWQKLKGRRFKRYFKKQYSDL